jgi:hypothetical protein
MKAKEFQDKIKSGEIQVGAKGNLVSGAINSQVMQSNFIQSKEKIKNRRRVDINLQPITQKISDWRKDHPGEIYFDSLIEGQFYHFLKDNNVDFKLKVKIEIQAGFEYHGKKIQPTTWTPDYVIRTHFNDIIIDTKGYPNDAFPLKYKMILHHFHDVGALKNLTYFPHVWFVSSKAKFPIALNCIRRVQNNQNLNGIEASLLFGYKPKKKKKK